MDNATTSKSDLTVLQRNQLSLTGVRRVKSSEPTQVVAVLDNCSIVISGVNLTVDNVSIAAGTLDVMGLVTGVRWMQKVGARKFSVKNMFR